MKIGDQDTTVWLWVLSNVACFCKGFILCTLDHTVIISLSCDFRSTRSWSIRNVICLTVLLYELTHCRLADPEFSYKISLIPTSSCWQSNELPSLTLRQSCHLPDCKHCATEVSHSLQPVHTFLCWILGTSWSNPCPSHKAVMWLFTTTGANH